MSIGTHVPEGHNGQIFHSPDLKFRDSQALWGPLHIVVSHHREGAERGYVAGEHAYQEHIKRSNPHQRGAFDELEARMNTYLTLPMYRPRHSTTKILAEWKALFLLGWTSQVLLEQSFTSHEQCVEEEGTTR